MGEYNSIRACLEQHLRGTVGIPDVVVPNKKYDPKPLVPFVRAQFAPLSRRPASVGNNPLMRHEGLYQLNVYQPLNVGEGPGLEIASILAERFKASTAIIYGGEEVGISYSEVGMPFPDTPFHATPVTVGWYAYT